MTDGEQSTESFFPRWRLCFSLLENGSKSQRLSTKRIFLAGSWVPGRLIFVLIDLIPWAYAQIHTPTVVQEGGGGGGRDGTRGDWWNPSLEFLMLQYFETTLPSMESLWSSQQDEVHFKGQLVLLGPCDVTNSARQLGRHLGFYK